MNWINNFVRPKIRGFLGAKREVPDNLWRTCPITGQMVFHKDLEANQCVFPGSDYHERMGSEERLKSLFDDGRFEKVAVPSVALDPLKFRDGRRYTERLKEAKANTGLDDAVLVGEGEIEGRDCVAAVQDFRFMAGSLGMAAGEAVIAGMLRAVEKRCPFILFAASGGARMQEGILSLMQMPRTTIAVQRLREARLPYIVVLTNPTSGGVTASYAMLGDVHIAEPGALICFAGPRVIQQTIREQLPEGFQRSEYLVEHGMVDMVVHRHKMRETLARLCRLLGSNIAAATTEKTSSRSADETASLAKGVLADEINGAVHSPDKGFTEAVSGPSDGKTAEKPSKGKLNGSSGKTESPAQPLAADATGSGSEKSANAKSASGAKRGSTGEADSAASKS